MSNNHINNQLIQMYPSLYSMAHKKIRGKPTTYTSRENPRSHRPFQRQILDDDSKDKVIMKSRQLGLSETALSEMLWFVDTKSPVNVVYTFPRDNQLRKFSSSRVHPAIKQSDRLKTLLSQETNSIYTKKIRDSYIFLTSAWGENLGEGVDCDLLCLDEYDRMTDGVEVAFSESLSSSKYGWIRRWSTPTIPGRGIDVPYNRSDMKKYVWTCPHCGHKQFLEYEKNVIQVLPDAINLATKDVKVNSFIIGCSQCGKEIDRMQEGEWVSYGFGQSVSGYFISQLDASWIPATSIKYRELTYPSKQLFVNYVLGLPYLAGGMSITEEDFVKSTVHMTAPFTRTQEYAYIVVGIDWGKLNWAVVLGFTHTGERHIIDLVWTEDNPLVPLESTKLMAELIQKYSPDLIVADAGYGADRNSYLYQWFGKSVMYSCRWSTQKSVNSAVKFLARWDDKNNIVSVDKTVEIKKVLALLKEHSLHMFHNNIDKTKILYAHINNIKLIDEEEDGIVYQIAVRVGGDHLGCALTYANIGLSRLTNNGLDPLPADVEPTFSFDFI